ncbi:MAG TPA: alkaline phosphatase family protein [Polyangia bacterium]|jgi:predicted AlkP superfamily phosphohydrolase/phosphomutase
MRRAGAVALTLALAAVAAAGCRRPPPPAAVRRVLVLGIDGMDPQLLQRFMAEGRTPHLKALAARGAFVPLESTVPPQSPVAWSTVITGTGPEQHGIFDFVHRDPRALAPALSIARVSEPKHVLRLGRLALPLGGGRVEQLRRGASFWELLEGQGVAGTVLKMPANFPPDERWRSRTLAGMGTPDLLGTYGTFQLLTDDPAFTGRELRGGIVHQLDFGAGQRAAARLTGPPDPFSAQRAPLTLPVEVAVDRANGVALVRLGDEQRLLTPGEWSDWVPVAFSPPLGRSMHGMVRLFLRSLAGQVVLYVSPINLDPLDPALPLGSPAGYPAELARAVGRFHTLGIPEDTKALAAGVFTPEDFLAHARQILAESERLARYELRRFDRGVLFVYFSTIDETSHVFYQFRGLEPSLAPKEGLYPEVMPALYARVDAIVGDLVRAAGEDTLVLVLSDHGFAPFDRKVGLNTWLARRGYLALRTAADGPAPGAGPLGHIDWPRTQAYALGLNGLYLNLRGREAQGVVPPEERAEVLARLRRELEAFVDPETGARVILSARPPAVGADPERAPDLIIGYDRGYRVADDSAIGGVGDEIITPNRDVWSADHCMDRDVVPGVLVTSRPLAAGRGAGLVDVAPTILRALGVAPPPAMTGRDLFAPAPAAPPKEPPR